MEKTDKLELEGIMEQGYGVIPKKVMKDTELSAEAKTIYAYLCSYCGGGNTAFPSISLMSHDLNMSDNRLLKYRKELIEKGYIRIEKNRDKKGFTNNVYMLPTNVYRQIEGIQNVGKQIVGIQNEGTNNNSNNNNNINKNKNNKASYDLKNRFENLWKEYPNKKGKNNAFKAYKKAVEDGVTDEVILDGIRRYNKEIQLKKTEKKYIAYGSTWFNQKRWEDDYLTNDYSNKEEKTNNANLASFDDIDWAEIYG